MFVMLADDGRLLAQLPKVKILRNDKRQGKKGLLH